MEGRVTTSRAALPHGRRVELAERGTTFVRTVQGPSGAATVVLLHGWMASGGLNWFTAFEPLSCSYHVVAPDLRGHGRGIRSRRRFRLADCADDVAALLEHLDTGPVIAVGYSMGGPVAQLLWQRHRELVAGLVLCATADRFVAGSRERVVFASMMAAAANTSRAGHLLVRTPVASVRRWAPRSVARVPTMRTWAAAELRRHDPVKVMEAGQAIGAYSSRRWISAVDVPTTVVMTARDRAVPPTHQARLAASIPGARVQVVDDGHIACAKASFGPALVAAVDSVAERLPRPT